MSKSSLFPTSLVMAALLGSASVQAVEIEVFKFLEFGAYATDNLQLLDETEEFALSVNPSVDLVFTGNRFETELVAEVEVYQFDQEDFTLVDPRLGVTTAGAIVENLLFLNASLNIGRTLPEEDFFDLTEDSDTQARLRFNPFLARTFGDVAELFLGYGHQSIDSDTDGSLDARQDAINFTLGRDPRNGGFLWGLGANLEQNRTDEALFENGRAFLSGGFTTSQSLLFELLAGQEINRLAGIDEDDELSFFGEARFRWTPSERTSLQLGWSERFFDSGPTLTLEHRIRNAVITASFNRGISTSDITLSTISALGETISSNLPTDTVDQLDDGGAIITGMPFTEEVFRLSYKLAGLRTDVIVDAVFSMQEELGGTATQDEFLARAVFDRQLSALTTLRLQYEHQIEESEDNVRSNENRVGVRLIYNFDRKERVSILEDEF